VTVPQPVAFDFPKVFRSELPYVWRTLRRLGVPDRDREDVAHEVFMVVHKRLHEYDATRPLRPWLFGIAYRRAADYRRLRRHEYERSDEAPDRIDTAPAADELIEAREARALLADALERVDFDRRAVLILHDLEEVTIPTIADALGIPVRTAYSRLRVGREELAQAVARLQGRRAKP